MLPSQFDGVPSVLSIEGASPQGEGVVAQQGEGPELLVPGEDSPRHRHRDHLPGVRGDDVDRRLALPDVTRLAGCLGLVVKKT